MDELEKLLELLNRHNVLSFDGEVPTVFGELKCKIEFATADDAEQPDSEVEIEWQALEVTGSTGDPIN